MKRVLLVDDSPTMLKSMSGVLSRASYEVAAAESGEAALAELDGGYTRALVITDLNMPGMNGIELIAAIRKLPRFRFTPILMLTTESSQEKRASAKSAGATGWIVKPVQPQELLSVVKQLVPGA